MFTTLRSVGSRFASPLARLSFPVSWRASLVDPSAHSLAGEGGCSGSGIEELPTSVSDSEVRRWSELQERDWPAFVQLVFDAATRGDASSLRCMMDLGFFDYPDVNQIWLYDDLSNTQSFADHAHAASAAVLGILRQLTLATVECGDGDSMEVWTLPVTDEMRVFHHDFCVRGLRCARSTFLASEHLDGIHKSMIRRHVTSTVATMLVTACAMNNAHSVRSLSLAFPEAMGVGISAEVLGMAAWDWFNAAPPTQKLNAYYYATQFSSVDCMEALQAAGHDPSMAHGFGPSRYGLACLVQHGAPACHPSVFLCILNDYLRLSSTETLNARRYALYQMAKSEMHCHLFRRRESAGRRRKPYLGSYIESGALLFRANDAISHACAEGLEKVLASLLPHADWASMFSPSRPWPLTLALECGNNYNKAAVERCMIAFMQAAIQAGKGGDLFQLDIQEADADSISSRASVQPIASIVETGMEEVLALYMEHGFDVTKQYHPDAASAMDYARQKNPRLANHLSLFLESAMDGCGAPA